MNKFLGVFLGVSMLIAPVGMIVAHADDADATTTAPVFQPGGHATNAQMQALFSPSDFQIYLASQSANIPVANPNATKATLIGQIISLLQQEITLIQAGQN